jgi:hypothetical protein
MPLTSALRSAETMPLIQTGAALRRSVARSRRLYWMLCSAVCEATSSSVVLHGKNEYVPELLRR